MEFKAINKKNTIPTIKESKYKLLNFLIENKKLTISAILLTIIDYKTFAISESIVPLAGDLPLYNPPSFFDILGSLAPFTIIFSLVTFFIFNIISNKKYEKLLNHEDELLFKKKKFKKLLFIFGIIIFLWLTISFVLYSLS